MKLSHLLKEAKGLSIGDHVKLVISTLNRNSKNYNYIGLLAGYRAGTSTAYYELVDNKPITGTIVGIGDKYYTIQVDSNCLDIQVRDFSKNPYVRKDGTTSDTNFDRKPQNLKDVYAFAKKHIVDQEELKQWSDAMYADRTGTRNIPDPKSTIKNVVFVSKKGVQKI